MCSFHLPLTFKNLYFFSASLLGVRAWTPNGTHVRPQCCTSSVSKKGLRSRRQICIHRVFPLLKRVHKISILLPAWRVFSFIRLVCAHLWPCEYHNRNIEIRSSFPFLCPIAYDLAGFFGNAPFIQHDTS